MTQYFADVDDVVRRFDAEDHLLDDGTAAALYLATTLGRPLLLEGEPGVGKTTAAKTLSVVLNSPLIRLQCYEGLTAAEALYDWNYQRQLLSIRLAEARERASRKPISIPRRIWSTGPSFSASATGAPLHRCC